MPALPTGLALLILEELYHADLTPADLADELGVRPLQIGSALRSLARRGFVRNDLKWGQQHSTHATHYRITPAGTEAMNAAHLASLSEN